MKNLIYRVWEKIKWPLFLVIYTAGVIGWTYFYQEMSKLEREADWAYREAVKIHQQSVRPDSDIKEKNDAQEVSASTEVKPIEERESLENSPTPLGEILRKIHQLESSGGKNDSCKNKGLVNGYGYGQNTFEWRCYKSQEEVEKEVAGWFERKLQVYSLAQATCLYNTGTPSDTCPYFEKFKTI